MSCRINPKAPTRSASEFMSLETFLDLTHAYDGRSIHRNELLASSSNTLSIAQDLLRRYKIARDSWVQFGDDGPPLGTWVRTLYGSDGGSGVFLGSDDQAPLEFLILVSPERRQVIDRVHWWAFIQAR